ncbi:MAG: hypothetical protein ABS52_13795 [Gemmatimonadetes bacterium SCN 70-22]|nr:MAG: hypothetical protein ABS52_13795 [Gemmatimonadetes bacterium SCN 70-22]
MAVGSPESTDEDWPLTVVGVGDERALYARLAASRARPCVIVLDPAHVAADPRIATRLRVLTETSVAPVEVVLFGHPTASSMRGVALLARLIECEIAVRGVDDEKIPGLIRDIVSGPRCVGWCVMSAALDLTGLPAHVRNAWSWAASDPGRANVKSIAFRAGVTRRSLERSHRKAGLPPPAQLLGML